MKREKYDLLRDAAARISSEPDQLPNVISKMKEEIDEMKKQSTKLK
jgi:uncharacterized protein YukE